METKMILLTLSSLLVAVSLAGCATEKKKEAVNISWPLPPDPPRVRYIRSIVDAKEVLPPKGFFKRAVSFLFGEEISPRLIRPYGLFVENQEKIWVTDMELQVVHLFDYSEKKYRQIFKLSAERLRSPVGIAVDAEKMTYVTDSELRRVFQFGSGGQFVKAWETLFLRPTGIAIDRQRKVLYVVDTGAHHVGAYSLKGEKLFEFGKRGEGEGEFNFPTHVAVHPVTGDIYVADSMNFRIERFTPDGKFIRHLGSAGERVGSFSKLKGISVDTHGIVYAVDGLYDTVEMFNDKGEFLMNFGRAGNHEGEFWLPGGIAVSQDQIYVSDSYNQRVQVFQLINAAEADGESR